jgi:hypothetical protein
MVQKRTDMPGQEVLDVDRRALRKKQRMERFTENVGKGLWPSAKFDQSSEFMSSEDDVDYFKTLCWYCYDPQYVMDGIIAAVEKGHVIGHWDELVAGNQTALDNYGQNWFELFIELMSNIPYQDYLASLANVAATDTATSLGDGQTGNVTIAKQSKSTIEEKVKMVQDAGLLIPTFVKHLVQPFNYVINLTDKWEVGGVRIPPSFMYPFIPYRSEDALDALIAALQTDYVKTERFCNQFGIKLEPFKYEDLQYKNINSTDPYLVPFWGSGYVTMRSTSQQNIYSNPLSNSNSKDHKFWFEHGKSPNDYPLHNIMRLTYPREADYNPYGGMIARLDVTQDGQMNILRGAETATELLSSSVAGMYDVVRRFYGSWQQTNTLNISVTGTYTTETDITLWPYAVDNNLKYYSKAEALTRGIFNRALRQSIDFTKVAKERTY